ncbi:MAG: murein transglycosylase [Planctomycetes bacterium]|nr:murein transglycosylase [Planctomycetota bacterium]
MAKVRWWLAAGVMGAALVGGCAPQPSGPIGPGPDYDRPLPPGSLALRRVTDSAAIPDFSRAAQSQGLRDAVARSLNYLAKPSSQQHFPYGTITHARAVASLKAMDELLAAGLTGEQLNAELRRKFEVYTSVGWNGRGAVLFTGYYTPIFEASLERTDRFRYPLYRPPDGLVKGPDGEILGIRLVGGQIVEVPARADLGGSGLLVGRELVWLADPFEAYIAHVQGSARLRLPDGSGMTVGYAASNGQPYKSIAKALVDDGRIDAERMSLAAMIEYFRRHPGQINVYVDRNPRFIFFEPSDGAPRGSLNEPVTPMRTIATDKAVYPRACLAFFQASLPTAVGGRIVPLPYDGFALDQDAGGAIRAPGRCDIYMGVGDEAGQRAGRTQTEGRLYYLFLKPEYMPAR